MLPTVPLLLNQFASEQHMLTKLYFLCFFVLVKFKSSFPAKDFLLLQKY